MRDLVLLAIFAGGSIWALRAPWIGAMLWTWISLMSPHAEFGYAAGSWPVASGIAGCTIIGLLITKQKQNPFTSGPMQLTLLFTIWVTIALPFSFYFDASLGLWERSMKIYLMLFVTVALIDDRKKLDVFIWVMVVSIGYFGVKGGLFTIATAGNYRIWGPGGFIGGNNELALALIVVIPFMRYLQTQQSNRWVKMGLTAAMGLSALAALGTYSRGALIGVAAMGAFFWWRSKQKVVWGILIVIIGIGALSVMPDQWWDRMNTIKDYDEDQSAMGRISAWWMAFNVAKSHLFGGGFMIYELAVAAKYSPDPNHARAAHSIYFQVLGEQGFIGLFIWMSIGVSTWLTARRLVRVSRDKPEYRWAEELGRMVQVSMIGFASTGAFLSLAYFDLPYNFAAVAVLALQFVLRSQAQAAEAAARAAAPDARLGVRPPPAGPMPPHRPSFRPPQP
jgi:putative inorganic carbon (hco3(-)) transporter